MGKELIKKTGVEIDRYNNINQKEEAAYKEGLTRRGVMGAIVRGLNAKKVEVVCDEKGFQTTVEVDDIDKQIKSADLGSRIFGDQSRSDGVAVVKVTFVADVEKLCRIREEFLELNRTMGFQSGEVVGVVSGPSSPGAVE